MELEELKKAIEAILFASGERMELQRLCKVLETEYGESGIAVKAVCPAQVYGKLREYVV